MIADWFTIFDTIEVVLYSDGGLVHNGSSCELWRPKLWNERYNELGYSPDGATAIRNPVDAFAVGGIDNRSKNKRGTLCYVPKCNNFGGHKFPSEATAKNACIK